MVMGMWVISGYPQLAKKENDVNLIKGLTKEQLVAGIECGTFLSAEQLSVVRMGHELNNADTEAMQNAYTILREDEFVIETDPEDVDNDVLDARCEELHDAMHSYAYGQGLEWDGKQFWEPSSC